MEKNWPNLFVPGAGKSGTSSLHKYLNLHPLISMSKDKEPSFFDDSANFVIRKPYYLDLFDQAENIKYRGDSSTSYMTSNEAINTIKSYTTEPKFIFVLRNPIDRAYSHYRWMQSLGYEKCGFEEAMWRDISSKSNLGKENIPFGSKHYYREGLYAEWVDKYILTFERKNVHIVISEQLMYSHHPVINECFKFLNLAPLEFIESIKENTTSENIAPRSYRIINHLLFDKRYRGVKEYYQKKVPSRFRIGFREFVVRNQKTLLKTKSKALPTNASLNLQQRKIISVHYRKDVDMLKKITGLCFNEWKEFT